MTGERFPTFLCLGAQKAGTTTLQLLLDMHVRVFLPPCKEVHYFSLHYDRGTAWYANHFHGATPEQCIGEITPYYLFHPEAPRRIHTLLPDVRLIVLLRDPVERALSQVFHSQRLGLEPLPLREALAAEARRLDGADRFLREPGGCHQSHQEHSYVSRSRYVQQLDLYTSLFGAEQLLLLRSEDLYACPKQVWSSVQSFLELELFPMPVKAQLLRANPGRGEAEMVPKNVRHWLRDQLADTYQEMESRYGLVW